MPEPKDSSTPPTSSEDFTHAANQANVGIVAEFIDFLRTNKKWWLTPIILMLMFVAALIFLSSTVAAPFIYSLF